MKVYILKSKGVLDDSYSVWKEAGNGVGITCLDEGCVKVLAFVLGGSLAGIYHIIKNNEISKNKPRKPGFPWKELVLHLESTISEQSW